MSGFESAVKTTGKVGGNATAGQPNRKQRMTIPILPFFLNEQSYALHAGCVERVMQAAEIIPLPQAPPVIVGVVVIHGRPVAVANIRHRFNLPPRQLSASDIFILAHTDRRPVILIADSVLGVVNIEEDDFVKGQEISPNTPQVDGIAKLADGMTIVHDLDRFLSFAEEESLTGALRMFEEEGYGGE